MKEVVIDLSLKGKKSLIKNGNRCLFFKGGGGYYPIFIVSPTNI